MSETTYEGYEAVEPETQFERKRYRFNYTCDRCGHSFSKTGFAAPKRDPDCPNPSCVEVAEISAMKIEMANLRRMLEEQKTPGIVGANNTVKAIDYTANGVMEDFGMTNLKDNIREGEGVAPNLPPVQQAQADNYFGAHKDTKAVDFGTNRPRTVRAKQMEMLGKRAIAGSFAKMAVGPMAVIPQAARAAGSPIVRVRTAQNDAYTGPRR